MATQAEASSWAKQLTQEAFAASGIKLREGDSLILVAAIMGRVLEAFRTEEQEALRAHLTAIQTAGSTVSSKAREAVAEEFGAQATRLRTELLKDAESASFRAESAVAKALSIPERKNLWRARAEGLFAGAILVLLGAFLMHWLSR